MTHTKDNGPIKAITATNIHDNDSFYLNPNMRGYPTTENIQNESEVALWICKHNTKLVDSTKDIKMAKIANQTGDRTHVRKTWYKISPNAESLAPKNKNGCVNDIAKWLAGRFQNSST